MPKDCQQQSEKQILLLPLLLCETCAKIDNNVSCTHHSALVQYRTSLEETIVVVRGLKQIPNCRVMLKTKFKRAKIIY